MSDIKVTTVKSGREYRVRVNDKKMLFICDPSLKVVWIYTQASNLGGYNISRFDGKLSPASIRKFFEETK